MRKQSIALGVLAALAVAVVACRRSPLSGRDAGADLGASSMPDALVHVDLGADGIADVTADVAVDVTPDVPGDATLDTATAACPAGAPPLDVCGCGCCGEAMGRACYYPSRGETLDAIPNPPPRNCAMAGCSFGVRHVCCADPGVLPSSGPICAIDTSIENRGRFTVTRRDGDVCTTLELGSAPPRFQLTGPPAYADANGWRGPCDRSTPPAFAIGGLGTVTPGTSGTLHPFPRYVVHVALFFDAGTGVADVVRIDTDEIAVAPRCTSDVCPPCGGACTLDARYTYGYDGGSVDFRHTVILAPPASFTHRRSPRTTMPPDMGCGPPIPACGGAALDVADVMAALADPDVQHAFFLTSGGLSDLFYGIDPRPSGGQVFVVGRDDGARFPVGMCPPGSDTSCKEIPAGISRLVSVLTAFDQQQLADPSCAFVRP